MGQGFAYAIENNGTREVVIKDSTGKDIAMYVFSGYLAFSGNFIERRIPRSSRGMTQGLGILKFLA